MQILTIGHLTPRISASDLSSMKLMSNQDDSRFDGTSLTKIHKKESATFTSNRPPKLKKYELKCLFNLHETCSQTKELHRPSNPCYPYMPKPLGEQLLTTTQANTFQRLRTNLFHIHRLPNKA